MGIRDHETIANYVRYSELGAKHPNKITTEFRVNNWSDGKHNFVKQYYNYFQAFFC